MKRKKQSQCVKQADLGPVLVIRGALIMSLLLMLLFSSLAGGIGHAEGAAPGSNDEPSLSQSSEQSEGCRVSPRFPDKVRRWCDLITQHAEKNDLSPDLIAALIWQELGGDPQAYSGSGAVGLMQVMPRDGIAAQFICPNGPCFASRPTITELEDPTFNVTYGTRMLAGLNHRWGDLRQALKAYGPKDVGFTYADTVLSLYDRYGND